MYRYLRFCGFSHIVRMNSASVHSADAELHINILRKELIVWSTARGIVQDRSVVVKLILGGVTMDQSQSKLESDHRQTDSSELPNSYLNKEEELKEVSKDHAYLPSAEEDNTTIEENKSVEISEAATEVDPEWRQFIQQELESMRNPEKAGQDRTHKETSSPPSLDQALGLIIEKLPFERLIDSTIRFFFEKSQRQSHNTFSSGGIRGGNSAHKPVPDLPQVKDTSNQAGFGNEGVSRHDAPSSVEAKTNAVTDIDNAHRIAKMENATTTERPKESTQRATTTQSVDAREGYFTLGSTKDDVRAVMGDPDNVQKLLSEERWSYGFDSITFSQAEQVVTYNNISGGLKVWLSDRKKDAPAFSLNSGVKNVLDSMGTPTSIMKLFNCTQWGYDFNTITFNSDNQVIAYSNISNNLNVWIADRDPDAPPFQIGSTKDEVLHAMGTPTFVANLFNWQSFGYGFSSVTFSKEKVTSYSDISKNLKLKNRTFP
ncbi:MAG: hypothetical protein JWM44_2298 [Bacilli bacterium]|nr:hypothetical protein [Bacilli bacterium]